MMEWMSRILDGEMADGADEDFGKGVQQIMWSNFGPCPNHKSNSA
jgi:hypothetical protein